MASFPRTILVVLFVVALAVRMLAVMVRGEYRPPAVVGAEAGVIAQHLLAGHGFATPFDASADASPSTHLPPLYPYFLAGLEGLHLSPRVVFYVAILVNLLASSLLPVMALAIGVAAGFPRPVSLMAAIALCFCPEAMRAVGLVWDEALLTTFTALILLYMIRKLPASPIPASSIPAASDSTVPNSPLSEPAPTVTVYIGIFNGLLALLNPAMCIALPCAWLAGLQARGVGLRKLFAHAFLLVATTFLGSSPWHFRNWFLLDPPAHVFIRGNFWLEVWSSLHPVVPLPVHPWQGSESLVRTDTVPPTPLTEQQYFAWCRERVIAVFRDNPRLLLQHVATQFNAFWLGIAEAQRWSRNVAVFFIAQGIPAIAGILGFYAARRRVAPDVLAMLCTLLIVFPLPYYLAGGAARYRHPIDMPLYLGAAWLVFLLVGRFRRSAAPA